ncbi:uncharacterized protein [Chironomus tepperi]|uniref:uncharacterized protein n=1 Tax=Chironomus tepperi TaxID=113505 RepID=UPI00391EF540
MLPSSYRISPKPPPPKYSDFNGYGWIIVICSFILYLIVDGIAYNLGLINSAWLTEFKQSETATAWIGSIFYSVPLLSAPITAQLVEKFGCKTITIICSIISTFGFVMSSYCGSIEQLYMTVGLIAGFGVSAGYVVGILSAERWFEKNRTLAIGIVSSGTGFGTFVIAPVTQRLLDAYGWRNVMFFLASLNVLMGVVGCFIREPQWVIDEMENKGVKAPKKNENHGIFEEHETSFGTFRRLSFEAIEDIKDVVRCHFHENYSHLEEVVEENGVNCDDVQHKFEVMPDKIGFVFDKSEVMSNKSEVMSHNHPYCQKSEVMSSKSEVMSNKSEVMSHNHPYSQKSEVMPSKSEVMPNKIGFIFPKSEVMSNKSEVMSTKSEVMSPNYPETSKSEVMSPHTSLYPQLNHNTNSIDHQFLANDSQVRNSHENNINNIGTETSYANLTPTSHENVRMSVHPPQAKNESYQDENLGSNGDCEALTSMIAAKNADGNCVAQNGTDSDQVFTICGQDLKNCQHKMNGDVHNLKVEESNLKSVQNNLKIEQHNLKIEQYNPYNEQHNSKSEQHNSKSEQHNLKIEPHNSKIEQYHPKSEQHNLKTEQHNLKTEQNNLKTEQHNLKTEQHNHKTEQHNLKLSQPNLKHPTNITNSIHNLNYTTPDHHQPPPYSHACYIFPNTDIKPSQLPKSPDISTIISKFIKDKFKMIKKIFSHFSNRDFTLLAASTFAIYALYNIPIYFIVELLKTYHYTEAQCANYISLIGISILVGMITLGYVGDVSGNHVKNVNACCVLACGIAEILLANFAENAVAFGACCVFFGFTFASAYVLIPKIAEMIVGVEEFATAIGLNFFVQGLALLVGIPFASTIYEVIGSWKIAFEICGTIMSFSSIFAFLVNVKKRE